MGQNVLFSFERRKKRNILKERKVEKKKKKKKKKEKLVKMFYLQRVVTNHLVHETNDFLRQMLKKTK